MAFSTTIKNSNTIPGQIVVTVTLLDTAGSSDATQLGDCDSITIQVEGTFASGAVAVQVSNDGLTYYAVPTAVSISAAGLKSVPADGLGFRHYKFVLSGGDGTASLTCTIVGTKRHFARAS